MKRILVLFCLGVISQLAAQKRINYNHDFTKVDWYGSDCKYALVYKSDTNIRMDFYDCDKKKVKSECFEKKFNPKDDDLVLFRQGEQLLYFDNGIISSRFYIHSGLKHGEEYTYARDGKLLGRGTWVKGEKLQGDFGKQLKSGYRQIGSYENGTITRSVLLDSKGDTSSVYIYHLVNSKSQLKQCIKYASGKFQSIYDFNLNYRDSLFKNGNNGARATIDGSVKTPPAFMGGDKALKLFLSDAFVYPKSCREKKIEGSVGVCFIIGREGNIIDIFTESTESNGDWNEALLLKAAAIQTLEASDGMWKSGQAGGKPVISTCRIPLSFEIGE